MDGRRPGLNRLPRPFVAGLAAVPVVFVAVFYLWPVATLVGHGVDADALHHVLTSRRTWDVVWFTTWQAVASTVLTLAIGIIPAHVISRFRFPGRRLLIGTLTAVFVLPTVVVGAAVLAVLPGSLERGVVAILAAHVVFNLAVVVRVVGATWEQLPADMEAAAATLGASPAAVLRTVTLPILRPAIATAAAIVFLFTFTSFGVVRVLGTATSTTIEVEVWRRATQLGDTAAAAVLSMLQLLVLGAVVWSSAVAHRRHGRALALRSHSAPPRPRGPGQRRYVAGAAIATAAVVVVPLVALVERSLRTRDGYSLNAWRRLGRSEVRPGIQLGVDPLEALVNSMRTAAWATAIAVVIGALAALAIVAAGAAGRFLDAGLALPLGTSAVTIGFGLLITFDDGWYDWRASWWLVPVGQALVAVPFVVRSTLGVLRSIEPDLVHAAATLGASPVRAWREVVLPHLWRPLAVAAGLAAAIALGEFGATSFLSRRGNETLPIAIERLLGRTGGTLQSQGFALAAILAAATVAIVVFLDVAGAPRRGGSSTDPVRITTGTRSPEDG